MLRLLPAGIVAGGFILTFNAAMGRSELLAQEERAAQESAYDGFARSSDSEVSRILRESDRVEALIDEVLAHDSESLGEVADSLGAFSRSPLVKAIGLQGQAGRDLILPDGLEPSRSLPVVTSGLNQIQDGQWAGMATYRVFSTGESASVTLVLDLDVFENEAQPNLELDLIGMVEPLPLSSVPSGFVEHGQQYYHAENASDLLAVREIEMLGREGRVIIRGKAEDYATTRTVGSDQVLFLTLAGVLASLAAGVLVHQFIRRFDRLAIAKERAERVRQTIVERFEASFTHAPIGVVELDAEGKIDLMNPRFARLLGYLDEELTEVEFLDLVDQAERVDVGALIKEVLSGSADAGQSERRYRDRNGAAVWVRESISILSTDSGSPRVLIQIEDISEERRTRVELHRKALYDELTGLPNRANLLKKLNESIETSRSSGESLVVMFVDLDKFKLVNDTYGHEVGDRLLIEVAERLRNTCRQEDTVARLGGDEFVILCRGVNPQGGAEAAARRYSTALNRPTTILGVEHEVRASIGFVLASDGTAEDLLRRADQAMYLAKSDPSTDFVRHDDSIASASANRAAHELALRKAVDEGELVVHYQPILRVGPGSKHAVVGIEALVRWNHPTRGLVNPVEFLPLADKLGLLEAIDEWCIESAASQLVSWQNDGGPDGCEDWCLSVNTSEQHYRDPLFVDRVARLLDRTGLEPHRLTLEREESTIYNDRERSRRTMAALRELGVRIVIDQFGRDSTRLGDLTHLDIDGVKLDRHFFDPELVDDADWDRTIAGGLVAIQALTAKLGFELVIGGVESEECLNMVRRAEIDIAQGFHFSRPMDAQAMAAFDPTTRPVSRSQSSTPVPSSP